MSSLNNLKISNRGKCLLFPTNRPFLVNPTPSFHSHQILFLEVSYSIFIVFYYFKVYLQIKSVKNSLFTKLSFEVNVENIYES